MKLLARSSAINNHVFTRLVHPDFILHDLHGDISISSHHLIQNNNLHVVVTADDMIDCLVGRRNSFIKCYCESELMMENIKVGSKDCYYGCKGTSGTWTVVTGADELIYKLCEAINNELFFDHKKLNKLTY